MKPRQLFVCGMSRSGTTLLTTVFDSHPDVSMGYELLPTGLPPLPDCVSRIREAVTQCGDSADACASTIEHASLAKFVRRCDRTRVGPTALVSVLEGLDGESDLDSIEMRARLSMAIVEAKRQLENASWAGFKINAPSVSAFHRVFPEGMFVYIARDPRDVVASHIANRFDRTLDHICHAWVQYGERFVELEAAHPRQAMIVRYEDLVADPDHVLQSVFDKIGLDLRDEARRFYESKASVHEGGHTNAEDLRRDFFTTSVARWRRDLSLEQVSAIEEQCGHLMTRLGYPPVESGAIEPIPVETRRREAKRFARRKTYFADQYGPLVLPHREGRTNLTWAEAARGEHAGDEILILRHDIDHDFETALRMARWEHEHGLRATYCVLHTAWYYGELVDGGMRRTRDLLECCHTLEDLGHEVNLHNNFPVVALQTGLDPCRLLADELFFLRSHGIDVRGTSTHGDEMCRPLGFRNYELFSESVYKKRGGPRTVRHKGHEVSLGKVSMHEFDLEYEAYDLPRDFYITDSGGNLRSVTNTRGRAGKRRKRMPSPPPYPWIVGILTHPVWWDFERDAPPGREIPVFESTRGVAT